MHANQWNRFFLSPSSLVALIAISGCSAPFADVDFDDKAPAFEDPSSDGSSDEGTDGTDGTDGSEAKSDVDGDGYAADVDCDDQNAAIHPGAAEVCDGIDNDCDGLQDDADDSLEALSATTFWKDADGDGFGDPSVETLACVAPAGFVGLSDDCDDSSADVSPDAAEICDGVDNDCNGAIDAEDVGAIGVVAVFRDADGDGFGAIADATLACEVPVGFVEQSGDCDDAAVGIHPDAAEICDSIDNNCNGYTDDDDASLAGGSTFWADKDGDGYGDPGLAVMACAQPIGAVTNMDDCDDADTNNFPFNIESCDGQDNDCDGDIDDADLNLDRSSTFTFFQDGDGDGFGAPAVQLQACAAPVGYVAKGDDCDDGNSEVRPSALEVCDGIDNDCDNSIDDDDSSLSLASATTFYQDNDGDGFGIPSVTLQACEYPDGYATAAGDCDDTSTDVHPGAFELCDDIDNDCNASTDEVGILSLKTSDSGGWVDVSDELGAVTVTEAAELSVCGGSWDLAIEVEGDLVVRGYKGATFRGTGAGPIINVDADGVDVTVHGVAFTGGTGGTSIGTDSGIATAGGAISCAADARLEINDSSFSGNGAEIGGGIASEGCDVDLMNVEFTGNTADAGEAIWMDGGMLRWAGGSVGVDGAEGIVLGDTAPTYGLLHAVGMAGAGTEGVAIGSMGSLVCSGTPETGLSFADFGVAVSVDGGGSFRSLGCGFAPDAIAVQPENGLDEYIDGDAWMDCPDTGCGALAITAADGTLEMDGVVSTERGADLDCELSYEVSAATTASACPDCAFTLEFTTTYVDAESVPGSCGDYATDSSVIMGFAPDYLGDGEGAMMVYENSAWVPQYSADIMGHYLIWSGLDEDVDAGTNGDGEKLFGTFSSAGQVVIR